MMKEGRGQKMESRKEKGSRTPRSAAFRWCALAVLAAAVIFMVSLPALSRQGEAATERIVFEETENTRHFKQINSTYGILVNADTGEILVDQNETERMYPASMTKVMTILVAAEHVSNLSDTVEITEDILEDVSTQNNSAVGFQAGERVTVADCMYGTVLQSGADAAMALGRYVAGSDAAFVELMNEKVEELGLSDTHFTNAVGSYDENHYTTAKDMAVIMQAAMENPVAKGVLSARQYTTTATTVHPAGITISNRFLKRMERQNVPGIVFCGKTGYIRAAGFCAVSAFTAEDGQHYICCTAMAPDTWGCIYDHAAIYRVYAAPEEETLTEEEALAEAQENTAEDSADSQETAETND